MEWSVGSKVKFGVGITLLVLLVNALLSYAATRTLISNDEWVRHTYEVISELEVTLSTLKDAETGERGYLITGSEAYLDPYNAAISQLGQHIRNVKQLTADNPSRQADLPILEQMIQERLKSLKGGIELRRNGDLEGARQLVLSGVGKRMMDALRQLINGMEADESQLLAQRAEESRKSQRNTILTFLIANIVACRSRDEAEGQPLVRVFNIVNEQTRQTVRNPAIRAIQEGTIVGMANHTVLLTKSGAEIPIEDSASPIKAGDGKILGAVLVFRDITARRKSEEERSGLLAETEKARQRAEAASRAKDEFLAVLSHELRTPLTAVVGWMQLLQGPRGDEESRSKALEVINRNLRVQTQLIDDLLNISQIITGKLQIRPETIDPLQVLKKSIDTARPTADAKQIALRLEGDAGVPLISVDPARLQQIVWNLLTNAIKFTPKGGTIRVEVRRVQSELRIVVTDTGQGISPEFLPQVFNRFSQADASTTRSHGGLGLGLALVRQLVELHGGRVEAASGGEGKGSKFTVAFPLQPGTDSFKMQEMSIKEPAPRPALEGLRVLLVEDDDDTREMIAYALLQSAASVTEAGSASEALLHVEGPKPDVIISDIGMAGIDGYQFLAKIRELGCDSVPAIAVTAYANPADQERALRSGFHAYLAKPIELTELISLVGDLARWRS